MDAILQAQAVGDARFFDNVCARSLSVAERERVQALLLKAYRWQYIVSGVQQSRFNNVLTSLTTQEQQARIGAALEPLMAAFTAH